MAYLRNSVTDFELANPIYKGATVTFYTVSAGVKTATKATLYSALSGAAVLPNPQHLGADGKFIQPVYVEEAVVATISGLTISDHDTGVIQLALGTGIGDIATTIHGAAIKATPDDADELGAWDSDDGLLKRVSFANLKAFLLTAWKDVSGSFVGLTLFKINFKNAANTFTSYFTNTNTASRTYTFPDRDMTVAGTDLSTPQTSSTGSAQLPAGTTAQRDGSPVNGSVRYNSTLALLEAYVASAWDSIITAAGVASSLASQRRLDLLSVSASIAAGLLTVGIDPCVIAFRSSTLSSGAVNGRTVANALSLATTATTASFGNTTAVKGKMFILAIDNAGTVVPGIIHPISGNYDETGILTSTTAIAGAANAADTVYTTSALGAGTYPYRVAGIIEGIWTSGSGWVTTLSLVQGAGGKEFANFSILSPAIPTTSGTTVAVTGLNSRTKTLDISVAELSSNGGANYSLQLGTSAGLVAAGYKSTYGYVLNAGASSVVDATGSIIIPDVGAGQTLSGILRLALEDEATNTWAYNGDFGSWTGYRTFVSGRVALPGTLDRFTLATSDTFDLGSISTLQRS